MTFVFRAAVVGAGTMGGEIAHAIASAGIPVLLQDVDREAAERAAGAAGDASGLITPVTDYDGFGDVDFVVEAVPEQLPLKQEVFAALDEVTPGGAILASNTSSLSISEIGAVTLRPDQVVGFHFFFPVSTNRLVEVTEGEDTTTETVQTAVTFAQAIRRVAIRCVEAPGFVVNRVLNAAVSELWRAQEEAGIAVAEVDRIVGAASASGLGPFYIADLLGLDTVVAVAEYLQASFGDRFYVHQGMRALVQEGHRGAKTGQGFYEHPG